MTRRTTERIQTIEDRLQAIEDWIDEFIEVSATEDTIEFTPDSAILRDKSKDN